MARGHLVFKAYNASKHPLSSQDIGSFVVAIVELRCLDVGDSPQAFARVSIYFYSRKRVLIYKLQTYWIEALSLRSLSAHDPTDEEFIDKVVQLL